MKNFSILILWIGLSQSIFVFAQTDIEKKKIDFLFKEIEQLKGAKFLRNGLQYTPKEASDYLRMKMKWNDNRGVVRSARDFIEKVAAKSSITGKPYQILMEDGTKIEMKTFLYQKLGEWKE
ncbi:MAG: DUF5329 family protein [Cyclobacteriaceae bacterium]